MSGRDFWSRRKAAVAAEAEAEQAARVAQAQARAEEAQAEKSDEELLADLGLKDPDTLEQGDDFSAFLASAVPERLRRRALRRLWLSNPALANLDELVDYGEDFTDAALAVERLQTTYQVGKGMMEHLKAIAAEEDAPEEVAAAPSAPAAEVAAPEDAAPEDGPAQDAPTETMIADASPDEAFDAPPTRRRMRFEFT